MFSLCRQLREAVATGIRIRWAKLIVVALSFVPAVALLWATSDRSLHPDTGRLLTRQTGNLAIIFLILTLAISPLRRLLDLPDMIKFRRALGLFAFLYGFLHIAAWRTFKLGHELYIGSLTKWSLRIGFFGFVLMVPLAATSTDRWVRWLGGKRWRALHSLAYPSLVAAVVHCCLLPNTRIWKLVMYSATATLLLLIRLKTTFAAGTEKTRSRNERECASLARRQ
jgi:sulfoxide reductase heme-binding subunit YedZ